MMDDPVDDVLGQRPGPMVISWHGAMDIVARAALSPADRQRILALPYPSITRASGRSSPPSE
jgi:hypothetical protein